MLDKIKSWGVFPDLIGLVMPGAAYIFLGYLDGYPVFQTIENKLRFGAWGNATIIVASAYLLGRFFCHLGAFFLDVPGYVVSWWKKELKIKEFFHDIFAHDFTKSLEKKDIAPRPLSFVDQMMLIEKFPAMGYIKQRYMTTALFLESMLGMSIVAGFTLGAKYFLLAGAFFIFFIGHARVQLIFERLVAAAIIEQKTNEKSER